MHKDLDKYTNQARFIQMIIDGKLVVSKKKKLVLVQELKQMKFKTFPKVSDAIKEGELAPIADNDDEEDEDTETGAAAYDYLLGVSLITPSSCDANLTARQMPIWSLTKERVEKLHKQIGDVEVDEWRFQLEDEKKNQRKVANMGRRASNKLKIKAGAPGRKRKAGSDDSDSEFAGATVPQTKTTGPKASKAVGGLLSYLHEPHEKSKKASKAKAPSAGAKAAQNMLDLLKKEDKVEDVWTTLDGVSDHNAKRPKAKVPAPIKKARAVKEAVESRDDDDADENLNGPAANRQPRAAARKAVKYNTLDDSSDGDDMLLDVGKMVKGIDTAAASADNSRPLFSASMSRPGSSAGISRKPTASKTAFDLDGDDTDYSKLAPPTAKKGPAVTARQTVLSDDDDDLSSDVVVAPAAKPKATTKIPAKRGAKPKAAATKREPAHSVMPKKMPLSPAAKAYAAKKAKTEKAAKDAVRLDVDSEDEVEKMANEIMDEDEEDEEVVARPRRAAAAAPKKEWVVSDDEDEDEDEGGENEDSFDGDDSDD